MESNRKEQIEAFYENQNVESAEHNAFMFFSYRELKDVQTDRVGYPSKLLDRF